MKIGVIGLGLIGGSVALSLRKNRPSVQLYGADKSSLHLQQALELNLVDCELSKDQWSQMDVLFLAIPVDATVKLLPQVLEGVSSRTLVIDMGSTKGAIVEAVAQHPRRDQFLAAHPIAGTEFSGPQAAFEGLFEGKITILCDAEKTAASSREKGIELLEAMHMRLIYMDAAAHDLHVAYVSHLSHVSSFMLGQTVLDMEKNPETIVELAGSGFASTVRLAKSSAAMWAPIFQQNKRHVLNALHAYIGHLNTFADALEAEDTDQLLELMKKANQIKPILEGMAQNGN